MKKLVSLVALCFMSCLVLAKPTEDNCEKLACDITKLQKLVKSCCQTLQSQIDNLEKTVSGCCDAQEHCCEQTLEKLDTILQTVTKCCDGDGTAACNTVFITSIPEEGLVITQPGHYIVCRELSFSGTTLAAQRKLAAQKHVAISSAHANNPFATSSFGVTIASNNVFFDLNNNTFKLNGANTGALLVLSGFTGVLVSNGFIEGDNQPGQFGVAIAAAAAAPNAAAAAAVSNVAFANVAAAAAAPAAAPAAPAAIAAAAAAPAAAAVAVAAAAAAAVPLRSVPFDPAANTLSGVLLEGLRIENSLNGLSLQGVMTNLYVRDVSINRSTEMGITQPSRNGFHGNYIFERVTIANSGLNGIYTTFNQDNWLLQDVQIRNSGLSGAIFEGTQNLTIRNSQISQSGAKGLVASIRQSQNVTIDGVEIFNAAGEALRVDNVQSLSVTNSKFVNYSATALPIAKIQDVNNGLIDRNQFTSFAGLADGLFVRNSRGLLIQNNQVKVFNNVKADTPTPLPPVNGATCNPPAKSCCPIGTPIGINLQGGVTATKLYKNVVSGTPSVGIAVQADPLNGFDEGIIIEDTIVDGAQCVGILFSQSVNSAVFGSQIMNGQVDGIFIDAQSSQTAVRDNTLTNNPGTGIVNQGVSSQIYHNFASGNGRNYGAGILVAIPGSGVGVLENING